MEKNVGELIDELSIVNIKIYHLEDEKRALLPEWEATGAKAAELAEVTAKITALNDQRSRLKNALTGRIEGRPLSDVKVFQ